MIKMTGKPASNYIFFLIKICIGVFAVLFLIDNNYISRQSLDIFQENTANILLAGICYLISQILVSFRIAILLNTIDYKITMIEAIKLTFVGNFVNNVIPGSIGGDIIKCLYLVKQESKDKGQSAGIVLLDRMAGLLALIFIGVISGAFLFSSDIVPLTALRAASILIVALLCVCSAFIFTILILSRNYHYRSKIRNLLLGLLGSNIIFFTFKGLVLGRKKYLSFIYSVIISIIIQIFALLGILSLISFHTGFYGYKMFAAVSSVVMLFNIIPVTPGNLGWTEMIAAFSWSIIGSADGGKIFFYWRIISVLCSMPGGFWYFFGNLYSKSNFPAYLSRNKEDGCDA